MKDEYEDYGPDLLVEVGDCEFHGSCHRCGKHLLIAGTCWLDGIQDYPTKGTRVLTVKGRGGRGVA